MTSKAGLRAGKRAVTSAASRSSIGISAPVGGRRSSVERRRDDVERDAVVRGEHGEAVRADLVRGVAVRRDPVGAGDDAVDLAAAIRCAAAESAITACGMPSASSSQAVSRAPCRSGRVSSTQTCASRPSLPGRAQRAERRAVAAGGEPARVAVRERARAGREERGRVRGHAAAALDLVLVERARRARRSDRRASRRAPRRG